MAKKTLSSINKDIEAFKEDIDNSELSDFAREGARQSLAKLEKEKAELIASAKATNEKTTTKPATKKPAGEKKVTASKPKVSSSESAIKELREKIAKAEKGISSELLPEERKVQLREHLSNFKVELEAKLSEAESSISRPEKKKLSEKSKAVIAKVKSKAKAATKKPAPVKKVAAKKTKKVVAAKSHKDIVKKYLKKGHPFHKQIAAELKTGRPYENVIRDSKRRALKPGKRISASGNVYYEYRANRSDKQRHRMAYLERGGTIDGAYYIRDEVNTFRDNPDAKWVRVTHRGTEQDPTWRVSGQALDLHGGDRDKAIAHAKKRIEEEIKNEREQGTDYRQPHFGSGGETGTTYLVDSYEERGTWTLYVSDPKTDKIIWQSRFESGEDETSLIDDGYMKHMTDVKGLEEYLKSLDIITAADTLVLDQEYKEEEDEEGELPEWVADEATVSKSDFQPLAAFLATKNYTPESIPYTTTGDKYEFFIGRKGDEMGVVLYADEKTHAFDELVLTKEVLKEIAETARIAGINKVVLYTNLGVEIHSRNYNEDIKALGIDEIVKVSESDIFDTGQYAKGGKVPSMESIKAIVQKIKDGRGHTREEASQVQAYIKANLSMKGDYFHDGRKELMDELQDMFPLEWKMASYAKGGSIKTNERYKATIDAFVKHSTSGAPLLAAAYIKRGGINNSEYEQAVLRVLSDPATNRAEKIAESCERWANDYRMKAHLNDSPTYAPISAAQKEITKTFEKLADYYKTLTGTIEKDLQNVPYGEGYEKALEDLFFLWRTDHAHYVNGKWENTGNFKGVNNSSGMYITNASANVIAAEANASGITEQELFSWARKKNYAVDHFIKDKQKEEGGSLAKGGKTDSEDNFVMHGVVHRKETKKVDYNKLKEHELLHPLGSVYSDGKKGYVANGYDWYSFPIDKLEKLNKKRSSGSLVSVPKKEEGGDLSRSKLQTLFAIYNYQDILPEDRENINVLANTGHIYFRDEQPVLTSRGVAALVESEKGTKDATENLATGGKTKKVKVYEVYDENKNELEVMTEEAVINFANTAATYEIRDADGQEITDIDEAIKYLEQNDFKVDRNSDQDYSEEAGSMRKGGLTAKQTYHLITVGSSDERLPLTYSSGTGTHVGDYIWEEGKGRGEKLLEEGKAEKFALYNKRSKDRSALVFNAYEKGGKLYQNKPENVNYSWRKDKKEKSKPAGWRFTEAGAKKLKVRAASIPSKAILAKYAGKTFTDRNGEEHRYVYIERRKDKSDIRRRPKYEEGGTMPNQGVSMDDAIYDNSVYRADSQREVYEHIRQGEEQVGEKGLTIKKDSKGKFHAVYSKAFGGEVDQSMKFGKGGYTAEEDGYSINVHGDRPDHAKGICKSITINGRMVNVCYFINNDGGHEVVEIYAGKNYIAGSNDNSYSRQFAFGKEPQKYREVVEELKKVHKKKFQFYSKGGELVHWKKREDDLLGKTYYYAYLPTKQLIYSTAADNFRSDGTVKDWGLVFLLRESDFMGNQYSYNRYIDSLRNTLGMPEEDIRKALMKGNYVDFERGGDLPVNPFDRIQQKYLVSYNLVLDNGNISPIPHATSVYAYDEENAKIVAQTLISGQISIIDVVAFGQSGAELPSIPTYKRNGIDVFELGSEVQYEDGGTLGDGTQIVVRIEDNSMVIDNRQGYEILTGRIVRDLQRGYLGQKGAEETKNFVTSELNKFLKFEGGTDLIEAKALKYLATNIMSEALGKKPLFEDGGEVEESEDWDWDDLGAEYVGGEFEWELLTSKEKDEVIERLKRRRA